MSIAKPAGTGRKEEVRLDSAASHLLEECRMRFVTLRVNDKGTPLAGAKVSVGGKEAGVTDDKGELVYLYRQSPPKGAELAVARAGYGPYRATRRFEAGEVVEVALNRQAVVTIKALTDEYGRATGLAGLSVTLDGKPLGKTDAQGALTYTYRGEPGKKAVVALAAPGHIPAAWKTTVILDGPVSVQHYFYPTTPKPIRIGIYRVVGNTPGADLSGVAAQTEQSLAANLFKFPAFREVPAEKLQAEIKQRKLAIERIAAKGWQDTPLRGTVDMESGRDKSNKNKIEANDPEMLAALAEAYYRTKKFSEGLEIFFEISQEFAVVRQIQEAMQAVYSMEQRSAGDVRIL